MIAQLRAELLKQRTVRTTLGLIAAMLALVLLAVLLHALTFSADRLDKVDAQLMVLGVGERMGVLFAALLGAVSVTSEFRHGTIRPTFLAMPRRDRVLGAKAIVSTLIGAGFGLVACGAAVVVGLASLSSRGITVDLDASDYTQLLIGGAGVAALWAAIGVGVGAVVRHQVPAVVGICAWQLFVETLLVGDVASVTDVGKFLPGWAAAAVAGQNPDQLLSPAVALVILIGYAAAATITALRTTTRRDVA